MPLGYRKLCSDVEKVAEAMNKEENFPRNHRLSMAHGCVCVCRSAKKWPVQRLTAMSVITTS